MNKGAQKDEHSSSSPQQATHVRKLKMTTFTITLPCFATSAYMLWLCRPFSPGLILDCDCKRVAGHVTDSYANVGPLLLQPNSWDRLEHFDVWYSSVHVWCQMKHACRGQYHVMSMTAWWQLLNAQRLDVWYTSHHSQHLDRISCKTLIQAGSQPCQWLQLQPRTTVACQWPCSYGKLLSHSRTSAVWSNGPSLLSKKVQHRNDGTPP